MSKEINNFIISTSQAIKSYAEGRRSFNEAKEEYSSLLNIYLKIENEKQKEKKENGKNLLSNLCYNNNVENYSLLSGVYFIDTNGVRPIACYGDYNLNAKIMDIIADNIDSIEDKKLQCLPSDENSGHLHNIYLYPIQFSDQSKTLFASVSSSIYFSEDKFTLIGKLINDIFLILRNEANPIGKNYFNEVSKDIENFFSENINDEYYVQSTLFLFSMIEKIFHHMGIHTLLEVSNEIQALLNNNYKHHSQCFMLSYHDYIVLQKFRRSDKPTDKHKKLEFICKDINIPFYTFSLKIDAKESMYNFWDKISTFENYIINGDIIR